MHNVVASNSCVFLFQWQRLWSYFCGEVSRKVRKSLSVYLLCQNPNSIKM